MPSVQFIASVAANLAYWRDHEGLADPLAWPKLDRERENLFRAVEFGLRLEQTWPEAAGLALDCFAYVYDRGYWSEWAPVLERALATCPDESPAIKGRLLNQVGSLYRKLRRLDEAQVAFEQAEAFAHMVDDPFILADTRRKLGEVHFRRHQYDEAERYARLALATLAAHGRAAAKEADARNLLGIVALGRGDYETSAAELYQACDLHREADEPIELARTMTNLCQTLSRLGRAAEVLALAHEAAGIFTEYDLRSERSRVYLHLGFFYYTRDDLAQAEEAFRQAYSPFMRRAGPVYIRSLIEMNLGNVLLLQGYAEESRAYFLSAVEGFRLVNSQTNLANSLDGLAETLLAAGDRQEAIALYEEALAIVTAIPEDAFAQRMELRFRGILEELTSPVDTEEMQPT